MHPADLPPILLFLPWIFNLTSNHGVLASMARLCLLQHTMPLKKQH